MKKTVKVRLPSDLQDEDLPDFVSTTIDSLYAALDVQLTDPTQHAAKDDVRVTSVALSDDAVAVNYKVGKPAQGSLLDDELLDTSDQRVVMGERKGRWLIFERFIPAALRRRA
jgi:hypothetical protein